MRAALCRQKLHTFAHMRRSLKLERHLARVLEQSALARQMLAGVLQSRRSTQLEPDQLRLLVPTGEIPLRCLCYKFANDNRVCPRFWLRYPMTFRKENRLDHNPSSNNIIC